MIENRLIKVERDDPTRCQSIIPSGQCFYQSYPGSSHCPMHGGTRNKLEEEKVRNYRLQKYRARVNQLADSEAIKSLREEIGIMRMVLEEIVNSCNSTTDLLLFSSKISDMTQRIERLVISCHRLESNLGFMMDKQAVMNISTQIVNVISRHIPDEAVIDTVIHEITEMIEQQ